MKDWLKIFSTKEDAKNNLIKIALDAIMIFFIVFALYTMIFDQLKYTWLAITIIALYMIRLWKIAKGYHSEGANNIQRFSH